VTTGNRWARPTAATVSREPREEGTVRLRLYLAGSTPNSQRAVVNLDAALEEFTDRHDFSVEYIDVLVETRRAASDSVIVTPTLIAMGQQSRSAALIGDLSDSGRLRTFLVTAADFA
jgi:hypothetical protein